MPTLLLSFKKADGGLILHGFLAKTDAAAESMKAAHAEICPQFGPAVAQGNTLENVIDVSEIPDFDAQAIDEWVDEMFNLDQDVDDGEEDDYDDPDDAEST